MSRPRLRSFGIALITRVKGLVRLKMLTDQLMMRATTSRDIGLDEALERGLVVGDENARLIAGGQTLVPMLAMRLARPTRLVDIARLADLACIGDGTDAVDDEAMAPARLAPRPPAPDHARLRKSEREENAHGIERNEPARVATKGDYENAGKNRQNHNPI